MRYYIVSEPQGQSQFWIIAEVERPDLDTDFHLRYYDTEREVARGMRSLHGDRVYSHMELLNTAEGAAALERWNSPQRDWSGLPEAMTGEMAAASREDLRELVQKGDEKAAAVLERDDAAEMRRYVVDDTIAKVEQEKLRAI